MGSSTYRACVFDLTVWTGLGMLNDVTCILILFQNVSHWKHASNIINTYINPNLVLVLLVLNALIKHSDCNKPNVIFFYEAENFIYTYIVAWHTNILFDSFKIIFIEIWFYI